MVELTFSIKNSITHLTRIVLYTCTFTDEIRLINSTTNQNVNAKSLMGVADFHYEPKDVLILQVNGIHEEEIALGFNNFIKNNF